MHQHYDIMQENIPPDFFAPSFFGIVLESLSLYAPCALTAANLRPSTAALAENTSGELLPILSLPNTSCNCRAAVMGAALLVKPAVTAAAMGRCS